MDIVINVNAGVVSVGSESRVVVFPPEYMAIAMVRYNTVTAVGSTRYVDPTAQNIIFTIGSIIATALALWQEAAPTADDMWIKIKEMRTKVNAGGVYVSGDWYHTDSETLAQYSIMYAAISVNSLPSIYIFNPKWKTMEKNFRPMTVALLKKIINIGMYNAAKNFANAEQHKSRMYASYIPSTYDYSTGWALTYI